MVMQDCFTGQGSQGAGFYIDHSTVGTQMDMYGRTKVLILEVHFLSQMALA